jgi:hypothetical protein
LSNYIKLKGKFYWAQYLVNPQEPFNDPDPKEPKAPTWNITFAPDKDALEIIRDLQGEGIKNVIKKDRETNENRVRFSRPSWIKRRGVHEPMSPPKVVGADPKKIGNGSEGILTLDVYEHNTPGGKAKVKAARLYGVEITKLVEFNKTTEAPTEELF